MRSTVFVGAIAAVLLIGCSESTDPSTDGRLSFSSRYTTQVVLAKTGGGTAVDSVLISRVRVVLRDIKFKSQASDSLTFRSLPLILDLSLTGAVQQVGLMTVPLGTYNRIEFDVHRVESPEIATLPTAEQALFAEFLAGERYSVIVNGTVYRSGVAPATFAYRSKIDAKQKIDLNPAMTVSESASEANATLVLSSASWFKTLAGALVDPTDPNNEGVIDENIKASIKVFKDNNRDGSKD